MSTPELSGASRPSPSDPEAFFKAQRRNRRATWRMSALCVVAAILMGIPLTLVLTPLLYFVAMLCAEIVNQISPLSPQFWQSATDVAKLAYRLLDSAINQRGTIEPQELVISLAVLLLPGIVFALVLWIGVLLLFRRAGVGGTLATISAREPNKADLKELQLSDTVQEMAIAAGLPVPRVMLIDSPGANAAAIGTCAEDAHIVISRRVLDDLDRDQLQSLLGHVVASVGNGDLRIAFTVTSVFETCGLIVAVINAPFGRQSRSVLWRIIRYVFRRQSAELQAAESEEVAELLADTMDVNSSDIERFFDSKRPGLIRKILRIVFFPFALTNLSVELTLWFFLHVLLGPCMAMLWRTRRYLADCGAVELTRNPDALASALLRLSEDTTQIPGAGWAGHLFVVNPNGDRSVALDRDDVEKQRAVAQAWQASAGATSAAGVATSASSMPNATAESYERFRKEMMSTVLAAAAGNASAIARMQAFATSMGVDSATGNDRIPNIQDLFLARRGDRAAVARLRMASTVAEQRRTPKRTKVGLQNHSFASFHPALAKREQRLRRMGAYLASTLSTRRSIVLRVFMTVLYCIMVPLLVAAGVMMLFVIAMMIGLNLLVLAIWLSAIHWAFAQNWSEIAAAVQSFISELIDTADKQQ